MAKESVLTPAEKASISIQNFIFHILIPNAEEPTYLSEVILTDAQKGFFCGRLVEAAKGTQYLFTDRDASTPSSCLNILENPENNFIAESERLANDFLGRHRSQMNSGVFITAVINITKDNGDEIPLISLIKMDHAKVYEYLTEKTDTGLVAKLQEIINTFVEDQKAIQKVALIDINDHYTWDILASQRHSTEGIAEYFEGFLSAKLREDASHWTRQAFSTVSQWAIRNKADLPEGQDPSSFKQRARQYLETHNAFDTDAFINMVVFDDDEEHADQLKVSLRTQLAEAGVEGQEFEPKPNSLNSSVVKNTKMTREGVTIAWDGDASTVGIRFETMQSGKERIIIETSGYTKEV